MSLRWLRPKIWAGETDSMNGSGQRDQALMLHVVKNRGGENARSLLIFFRHSPSSQGGLTRWLPPTDLNLCGFARVDERRLVAVTGIQFR